MKFGLVIGNIISTILLTVFYYTVFAIFAIPFRLFSEKSFYGSVSPSSNWIKKEKTASTLLDFSQE